MHGVIFSEAAFGDLRQLGARSEILVLLRSDDAHASDGALGAVDSCPREQA
jgi:hypothetical protein